MRKIIMVLMIMAVAGTAVAVDVNTVADSPVKNTPIRIYTPPAEVKVGGDTIDNPTIIGALPYSDTGNTCGYGDDYDEACGNTSTSPDVVYSYVPDGDSNITVDLCGSGYDTKVYVYDQNLNRLACDDDYYADPDCGLWTSKIPQVSLMGGETYFIVIDGYGGDCGDYILNVYQYESPPPCNLICPSGAIAEDEPPLVDEYEDTYNAGCLADPPVFQDIGWANTAAGEAYLCGVSGWYLSEGSNHRDTDWFTATADASGTMSFTVESEYPSLIYHLTIDEFCSTTINEVLIVRCNIPQTITIATTENEVIYWLVAPWHFSSPDGTSEFPYVATLTGHLWDPPVPTEEVSWGGVKALYR